MPNYQRTRRSYRHAIGALGQEFSPAGVATVVRAIQRRKFYARVSAAGCVGDFVTLAGLRAIYYGRTGDTCVERFPGRQVKRNRGRRNRFTV
jgi:hypothetical protein